MSNGLFRVSPDIRYGSPNADSYSKGLAQGPRSVWRAFRLQLPTAPSGCSFTRETGYLGEVLNAVDAVDGTTLFEYDNFEFVVAEIPSEKRDELLADVRVAFIEDDEAVGILRTGHRPFRICSIPAAISTVQPTRVNNRRGGGSEFLLTPLITMEQALM